MEISEIKVGEFGYTRTGHKAELLKTLNDKRIWLVIYSDDEPDIAFTNHDGLRIIGSKKRIFDGQYIICRWKEPEKKFFKEFTREIRINEEIPVTDGGETDNFLGVVTNISDWGVIDDEILTCESSKNAKITVKIEGI